uniref:Uncharacterized protein n=1 Tax=Anguilla anguilla TaxID=7936 RepID=A0A0E9W6K8_ANGAN
MLFWQWDKTCGNFSLARAEEVTFNKCCNPDFVTDDGGLSKKSASNRVRNLCVCERHV